MTEGQFYLSHKGFDGRHPEVEAYERVLAAGRQARGLPAGREFPCAGALREVDRLGSKLVVQCDVCGYCVSVPSERTEGW